MTVIIDLSTNDKVAIKTAEHNRYYSVDEVQWSFCYWCYNYQVVDIP